MDDALRRAEGYKKAGADVLLLLPRNEEEVRRIGERLEPPLMYLSPPGGLSHAGMTLREMGALGYRIVVDPSTPLLAAFEAMATTYRELAEDFVDQSRPPETWRDLQRELHETIELDKLLDVEKRTVEKGGD